MNDRELLELAAKAAGVDGVFVARYAADGYPHDFVGIGRNSATIAPLWNPLTDDGDALRLAVSLSLDVDQEKRGPEVWIEGLGEFIVERCGSDRLSATRRAIVRAAAEIGRTMP